MAKAQLRKTETTDWKRELGRAVQRAVSLLGWTLKEFAAHVNRDERQCARWITGDENPQFALLFSVDALRQPLVVALAQMVGDGVEVTTHITVRRPA